MKRIRAALVLLLCATFSLGLAVSLMAGGSYAAKAQAYEGQIKWIKIDKCGLQPGSCELSHSVEGGWWWRSDAGIKPGTWLKRGDQFVTIDELGVGNYVKVEAVRLPGEQVDRITILETARE